MSFVGEKALKELQAQVQARFAERVHEHSQYLTEHPQIELQDNTNSNVSPAFGETLTIVDNITLDSNGHILKLNLATVTVPNSVTFVDTDETEKTITISELGTMIASLTQRVQWLEDRLKFKASVETDNDVAILTLESDEENLLTVTGDTVNFNTGAVAVEDKTLYVSTIEY